MGRFLAIATLLFLAAAPVSAIGCSGRIDAAGRGAARPVEIAGAWGPLTAPDPADRVPLPPSPAPVAPAPAVAAPAPETRVTFPTVAVLLPLSGEYATFGEPALRGIRLGLDVERGGQPNLRALVHDTRGDAGEAGRAYRAFAADPNVIAVLGPMLAWELDAVKPAAVESRMPTISFSQREVPSGGPIFRFSMTRGDQAAVLAEYVVTERGLERFAILYPEDSYGNELADAFRTEVSRRGGTVVASSSYDRSKVDLQAEVGRLRSRLGIPETVPVGYSAPIDAVFIPDSADKVAVVAPFLPYLDIRGVQLLGANGWNQPEALARGMPHVDGSLFVDGFYAYSFLPETRAFVDAYRDAHGSDPGILEAFGYDAAKLVRDLYSAGAGSRESQLRSLLMPRAIRGATGTARFAGGGRVDRSLFVLRFSEGAVREVERASLAPVSPAGETQPSGAAIPSGGSGAIGPPSAPWELPTPRPGVRWLRPEYDSRTAPGTTR